MLSALLFLAAAFTIPAGVFEKAFDGKDGGFVIIDCANGDTVRFNEDACARTSAPCSTFKIWNSAIGLETGLVTDPDAPFWSWDGVKHGIDAWNKDQTLRSAIAVSCVPAYQQLARQIGQARMQEWLNKIGYGNRDTSAGLDVFWLNPPGRKPIQISPDEQTALLVRLVQGKLPFSAKTLATLKSIMQLQQTDKGTLYGKTGTGGVGTPEGTYNLGWFVGYVESSGKTYAFACRLDGLGLTGKDARALTENILSVMGLL